jgi:imidazolonepropionase-like amidohydrolase
MRASLRSPALLVAANLLASPLAAQAAAAPAPTLALTHANVVDGRTATVVRDATILIGNGRIRSIRAGAPAPADAMVIDLQGRWVAPGLIDAHTHIATLANARRALHSGVTTVRSASVPAFQDVAMRDQARAGQIAAPDVLATGRLRHPEPWGDGAGGPATRCARRWREHPPSSCAPWCA